MNGPDYVAYHRSFTNELHSLKNRIRDLVKHWPTDGEFKESILRAALRQHLPDTVNVGRGFIVSKHESSTQIDILIVKANKPTLFREGDLMIVTPDCVQAIIEVKTNIRESEDFNEYALTLANNGALCSGNPQPVWLGLFSYECGLQDSKYLLNAVESAYRDTDKTVINCISFGKDRFLRFWHKGEREQGDEDVDLASDRWKIYDLPDLASSYFIGNVIDSITEIDLDESSFAWFPLTEGKNAHLVDKRVLGDNQSCPMTPS